MHGLKSATLATFQKSTDYALSIEYFLGNHFFSNDLKTPSVEMDCLLDIQNEIQAV